MAVNYTGRPSTVEKLEKQLMKLPYAKTLMALGVAGYVGYDQLSKVALSFFSSAPDGMHDTPIPVSKTVPALKGKNPPITVPVKSIEEQLNKDIETINSNFTSMSDAIKALSTAQTASTQTQATPEVMASPFLSGQLGLNDGFNAVVNAMNAQTLVLTQLVSVLHVNMTAMTNTGIVNAQNIKVMADTNVRQADKADELPYIDSDSFYSLMQSVNPSIDSYRLQNARTVESQIISDMSIRDNTYQEIKDAVKTFRTGYFSAAELLGVGNAVVGITQPSKVSSSGVVAPAVPAVPDYTVHMEKLAAAAVSSKVVSDHAHTVRDIHDLDGAVVARMAPMEATAAKNITGARTATDVNSDDYTNDLPPFPDLFPVLQFSGRGATFDPAHVDNGNPFEAKNLSFSQP